MRNVPDYVLCIGGCFYGDGEFAKEAKELGISRRVAQIPKGMVPGKSRVYCCYDAGRDSHPKKCDACNTPLAAEHLDDGANLVICPHCSKSFTVKKHKPGKIKDYFIPDRIEVVLRISEDTARNAVKLATGLGLFQAQLEESPETLRVRCAITGDTKDAIAAIASMTGVAVDADLVAPALTATGAQVVCVAKEPKRGCGVRKHAGTYLVSNSTNKSPLVPISPPITYRGEHFRGLKTLCDSEAKQADEHLQGLCYAILDGEPADRTVACVLFDD